jgi:pimeloyl-ACP methyl ester carboxylesterase
MQGRTEAYYTTEDGDQIWYEQMGQGRPAFLLYDGVGCTGYIWKYLIQDYAPKHTIIHPQYRGHGHSPDPHDLASLSISNFARDGHGVAAKVLGDEPYILIGHSMGVQVCLEHYRLFPEKIQAMILINGPYEHALRHVHGKRLYSDVLPAIRWLFGSNPELVRKIWEPFLRSPVPHAYALLFELNARLLKRPDFAPYFQDLARLNPQVFIHSLSAAQRHSAAQVLSKIKVPVLLVASESDKFTPLPVMSRMRNLLPQAEWLLLPSGTHTGPLELPELIHLRMDRFLRRHQLQGDT